MPDYGGGSTYKGGSGYTTSSQASSGGSKASQRRKKAAKAAEARAKKALADQKKIDAAKAASTQAANQQKAAAVAKIQAAEKAAAAKAAAARESNVGYGAPPPRQAPEIDPRVIASQQAAARQEQARFAAQQSAQQAAAQRAAAAQAAANQQKSNAIAQIRAAEQAAAAANRNRTSASTAAANQQAAQSLLGAGYRNVKGDKNKSTIFQQIMSGIRNTLGGEGLPGDNPLTAKPVTTDGPSTRLPPQRDPEVDPFRPPPEIVDPFRPPVMPPVMPPQFPQYPGYGGGMMGGIGAFGYNPALMAFESQQGAGQVPYYMAAARNAQTPNMSPAFMHAARNYDILGGSQRTAPRPMEMMSAAERAQIASIGSNFNTPNYNSPYYQPSPRSEFDFFKRMVGDGGTPEPRRPLMEMFPEGPPTRFGGPGKGAPRSMPQDQSKAVAGGLAALMNSGMFG